MMYQKRKRAGESVIEPAEYVAPGDLGHSDSMRVAADMTMFEEPFGGLGHAESMRVSPEYAGGGKAKSVAGDDAVNDDMKFSEAFKAARKVGLATFSWRGKKYHTRTKEEMKRKRS